MDLAGIIIGAAFCAIVKAAVDSILMPIVGILIGGIDIKSLKVKVGGAELAYGLFLQSVIEFIIIAFFLFLIVQAVNKNEEKRTCCTSSYSGNFNYRSTIDADTR